MYLTSVGAVAAGQLSVKHDRPDSSPEIIQPSKRFGVSRRDQFSPGPHRHKAEDLAASPGLVMAHHYWMQCFDPAGLQRLQYSPAPPTEVLQATGLRKILRSVATAFRRLWQGLLPESARRGSAETPGSRPLPRNAGAFPESWPEALRAVFQAPPHDMNPDVCRVPITDFARPLSPLMMPNGQPAYIALFETTVGGDLKSPGRPWMIAHHVGKKWVNGRWAPDIEGPAGGVQALTIVRGQDGREYVHFTVERRPPFGGALPIIQLPSGVMDKPDATVLELAMSEVYEETRYRPVAARLLLADPMPTSPGCTTEQRAFAVVRAVYDPAKDRQDCRQGAERFTMDPDGINLPLEVFADTARFNQWIHQMTLQGYKVGMDVATVRGLIF